LITVGGHSPPPGMPYVTKNARPAPAGRPGRQSPAPRAGVPGR